MHRGITLKPSTRRRILMNSHSAIECPARLISMARNAHVSARHSPLVRDVIRVQVTFSANKDGQAVIVIKVSSIYFR